MHLTQAVEYGSGLFFGSSFSFLNIKYLLMSSICGSSGQEVIDTVSIGDLTITQQSIGDASFSAGFDGVDGIIGYENR